MFVKFFIILFLNVLFTDYTSAALPAEIIDDSKNIMLEENADTKAAASKLNEKSLLTQDLPEEQSIVGINDDPKSERILIDPIDVKANSKDSLKNSLKEVHNAPVMLSKDALLEKIKHSIKPVIINDEGQNDIAIRYEMPHLQLEKEKNPASGKSLTMSVVDKTDDNNQEFAIVLNKAYKAAMQGQLESSIVLYKKALSHQPSSLNAMYALAAIYHKLAQYSEAKNMYQIILGINPNYQDALNNYLVVMAEESPEAALVEFRKLEAVNPNYSPVQAQIGMVYAKIKDYELAERYLKRAVILSPEVSNYRYNLAVLYDKTERYKDALIVYKQLLAYEQTGSNLQINLDYLRSRILHLSANEAKIKREIVN